MSISVNREAVFPQKAIEASEALKSNDRPLKRNEVGDILGVQAPEKESVSGQVASLFNRTREAVSSGGLFGALGDLSIASKGKVQNFFQGRSRDEFHQTVFQARQYLQIPEDEMPNLKEKTPSAASIMNAAFFDPITNTLNYGTLSGNELKKVPMFLFDRASQEMTANTFEQMVAHELTHGAQFNKAKYLTKQEALECNEEFKRDFMSDKSELEREFFGAVLAEASKIDLKKERKEEVDSQKLEEGKDAYKNMLQAFYGNIRMRLLDAYPYIESQMETEARSVAADFCMHSTASQILENSDADDRGKLLDDLSAFHAEWLMNERVYEIGELRKQGEESSSTAIAEKRNEIYRLMSESPRTPTKGFYKAAKLNGSVGGMAKAAASKLRGSSLADWLKSQGVVDIDEKLSKFDPKSD